MPTDELIATPSTLSRGGSLDDRAAGQVQEMVDSLRADFEQRNTLYDYIDAILFGDLPIDIPEAYRKTAQEVRAGLATHIANTVTAALSVNDFNLYFEPIGFGDSHQRNATLREHFFEASWRRQEEEARRRLFRLFMRSLVVKGEGVLKTVQRTRRAWGDYTAQSARLMKELEGDRHLDYDARDRIYDSRTEELKRAAPYPICTTDVPPETFYYLKGEDGFTYCCEVKEVPYYDALTKYKAALDSKGHVVPEGMGIPSHDWSSVMGKRRTLTMIEAWDYEHVTYILVGPGQAAKGGSGKLGRGTNVKRLKHGYGVAATRTLRGPYFHALGITTESRLPHRAGLGVLYGFLDLFPLLDSYLTIQSNSAYQYGYPAFKRNVPPGGALPPGPFGDDGAEGQDAEQKIEPGTIYPFDVSPVEMPRAGIDIDKMISNIRGFIELALPSVVQGVLSGDESGYALNQAATLARLAWDPIVDNAEFALSERVGFESWLIEKKIRETVYVWGEPVPRGPKKSGGKQMGWLAVGPDDLSGVHRYKARLDPETPSTKVIEVREHQEMVSARFETPDMAIEALGHNPDEVERGWLLYEMKQDEEVKKRLRQRVFEKLGLADQEAIAGVEEVVPPEVAAILQAAGRGTGLGGELGQVYQPGQNGMPLTPTPAGARTGVGPGGVRGMPAIQGTPQGHQALPGEG